MIEINLNNFFNLDATLDCGQAFRWEKIDNHWLGVLKIGVIDIVQEGNVLKIEGNFLKKYGEKEIKNYMGNYFNVEFDFNTFQDFIMERTPKDKRKLLKEILNFSRGMRILNQEPLETTISYLFSIQSSIPLIKKRIETLSKLFEKNKMEYNGNSYYLFPLLKDLKQLDKSQIASLKLGFREKYFINFLKSFKSEDYFKSLFNLTVEDKIKRLKTFYGIGDKVARCILLFSLKEYSVIPVDVWIKRFFENYFEKNYEKFYNIYYPYGGILQEYIYRWIRVSY